jgi:hypothetical protein
MHVIEEKERGTLNRNSRGIAFKALHASGLSASPLEPPAFPALALLEATRIWAEKPSLADGPMRADYVARQDV